jgi:hypothetical protein
MLASALKDIETVLLANFQETLKDGTALVFSSPRCLSHAFPTKRHGTCRAIQDLLGLDR